MDVKKVFRRFSSMRISLGLMGIIVLISLVATVFFPDVDVFHTTPFRAILIIFCLNLALCTKNQIKLLILTAGKPPSTNPGPSWQSEKIKVSPNLDTGEVVGQFLKDNNYRYITFEEKGGTVYSADKNISGKLGTVCVHLALLIVAIGALAGNFFGFSTLIIVGKSETAPLPLSITAEAENAIEAQIKLNDFKIEYYSDGSVSEYISDVEVSSGNDKAAQLIKVNHPLMFKNVSVYQMSYGNQSLVRIYGPDGGSMTEKWLSDEEKMPIDTEKNIYLQFIKYVPDFDPHRPSVSRSPEPNDPRILYAFYQDDEPVDWGVAEMGQRLRLRGSEEWLQFDDVRPFSEFEVKYDPGLPAVFGGLALLSVAFCLSSYLRYHRLYIKLEKDSKNTVGTLAIASVSRVSAKDKVILTQLEAKLTKGD